MLGKIKKYIKKSFWNLVRYILTPFIKIDDKLLLFGTVTGKFTDNAKYLYLYILENDKNFKPVWITNDKNTLVSLRNKNFPVEKKNSFKTFILAMKAKFYFFSHNIDDVFFFKRKDAIGINLWHGSPLKKIGFDSKIELKWIVKRKKLKLKLPYEQWDYIVVANKTWVPIFKSAMKISEEKILPLGLPRNDILWKVKEDNNFFISLKENVCNKLNIDPTKKIILYAPTFRDNEKLREMFILNLEEFLSKIKILLEEIDVVLIVKLHPLDASRLNKKHFNDKYIIDATNYEDTQELLAISDILISDYSSLIFDFTILNRPILFFWYDLDEYIADRGGFYDIRLDNCGNICYSILDIKISLKYLIKNQSGPHLFNKDCYRKFNLYGNSSENIIKFIKNL